MKSRNAMRNCDMRQYYRVRQTEVIELPRRFGITKRSDIGLRSVYWPRQAVGD